MHCQACVDSIGSVLKKLQSGNSHIDRYDIDLANQAVFIEGNLPPSRLTKAFRESGRQVIVRGVGSKNTSNLHTDGLGAAVCILETPYGKVKHSRIATLDPSLDLPSSDVHGLARLVQVGENMCLVDVTVQNLKPNSSHSVWVGKGGDVSRGIASLGGQYAMVGKLVSDEKGWGDLMIESEKLKVWDIVGRSMAIERDDQSEDKGLSVSQLVGVIARSAGVWENTKKVCACSGRTLWQEHRDLASKNSQAAL